MLGLEEIVATTATWLDEVDALAYVEQVGGSGRASAWFALEGIDIEALGIWASEATASVLENENDLPQAIYLGILSAFADGWIANRDRNEP